MAETQGDGKARNIDERLDALTMNLELLRHTAENVDGRQINPTRDSIFGWTS